jgi:class 3 adenylate cyclase/tetratricopeptide (TPR) repeat protein
MRCPRCGFENPTGMKFCGQCATPLTGPCPACGFANPPGFAFCGQCATPLTAGPTASRPQAPLSYTPSHLAERILTSKAALEGERKQVTVLFADLKGSMELLAERDPEDARALLDPVLERMMAAVHRYEGTVNQVMGDGIMALFGAPIAHEDHAVRACYAALAMQEAIRRYSEEARRAHGITVQIRMGLNSGEVVVRTIGSDLHMDYTAVGQTTHLAARMEQMAMPGSILITPEVLRLAEGYVQVSALGPVPIKGLHAPLEVYEVLATGMVRSRLQAAAVRGLAPFVGRDRELSQVHQALEWAGGGHGQVVALVGEPGVGKSRLAQTFPTIQVPATVQAVLAARIDRLPTEEKRLLQTAAVIGTEVPLALAQSIADLPEEALHRGLAHLQAAEFLYETRLFPDHAYTFKHALTHEVAYGSLLQERRRVLHARLIETLEALAPERGAQQVERLAHHALRGEVWDKAVTYCQQAGARAHGRAAFHEAVTALEQALQALDHLPESGDTRVRAIEIRLALGGALTQLGESRRDLALLGEAEALARTLDDRVRLGRVLAQRGSVLRVTGDLDGAIAAGREAFEFAAEIGDRALQASASRYLGTAYYAIGDFGRAADLFRRNVEAADRDSGAPSTNVWIQSQAWLAFTLGALGAFAEGRRYGEEALRLATLAGRGQTPIVAHSRLGHLYLSQGDLEHAVRVLEQGLALCRASGNRVTFPAIAADLGYASALQGRLAEGRALLEEAISEGIRTGGLQSQAYRLARLSEVCRLAGNGEEAWQRAHQALELARQQKARGDESLALHQLGVVLAHASPPDIEQAEAHYRQALTLAEALGMRPLQAHCHLGLGRLYHQTGRGEEARAALTAAIDLYRAMDMTFWLPQAEAALAQVEGR